MLKAFGFDDPGLRSIAEIVHEIDLPDGLYVRSEVAGVDVILRGWQALPDADRETHGVALFEGLYAVLSQAGPRPPRKKRRSRRDRVMGAARRSFEKGTQYPITAERRPAPLLRALRVLAHRQSWTVLGTRGIADRYRLLRVDDINGAGRTELMFPEVR